MIDVTKSIRPSLPVLLMLMVPSCTQPGPGVMEDGSTGQEDPATTTSPCSTTADETAEGDTETTQLAA